MNILYFYPYFGTPKGSWSTRVYDFAKDWVEKGHRVTVVTGIYAKSDLVAEKFVGRRIIDGIDLIVLNIRIDNKQKPLRRIWTFIQYAFTASWFALKEPCDVAISSSGPISVGLPGLVSRIIRRKQFVFEVRDLWPDTAIRMGYVRSRMLKKCMYVFEKFCYKRSNLIVTLSPGSAEQIQRRYGSFNIISVPNGVDLDLFSDRKSDSYVRSLPDPLKPRQYAIYSGNIGQVNNSRLLLEAARLLKQKNVQDLCIVLVGDGPDKQTLIREARTGGLELYFLVFDLMPKVDLVPVIRNSLASLIPLAPDPLLDTSSPNKLAESLAAGVPVIQTTRGWIRDMLDSEQCGYTVDAEHPEDLVDALQRLQEQPETRNRMAENAERVAAASFDKDRLAGKMLHHIQNLFT